MKISELEQWKQYKGDYWVSSEGRVKRVYANGHERYLTPVPRRKDYPGDGARIKIYGKSVDIKHLVWEAFNGPVPEGYSITYRNGCRTMNDISNLVKRSKIQAESI